MSVSVTPSEGTRWHRASRMWPALRRRGIAVATALGLLVWSVAAGLGGPKGAAVAAILTLGASTALMIRPGLKGWLLTASPTGDVGPVSRGPLVRDLARITTGSRTREAVTAVVLLAGTLSLAIVAGLVGEKAVIIVVGIGLLLAVVAAVKNRTLFFMFALSASFSFIMYKKFTPMLSESYAPAIYITTVNVLQVFQFALWAGEGTLYRDLRKGLREPVFMLPFAGIGLTLLSAINAQDQRLVWAEIVRYIWVAALFVYVGIRVRRKEHVWAVLAGLILFLSVQVVVTISQKMTGGFLGLPQLALRPDPDQLNPGLDYTRPFGTQIHPVFLACVVISLALFMASFALHLPSNKVSRYFLLSSVPLAIVCTGIARARGPLTALVPALVLIVGLALRRRLLTWKPVVAGMVLSGIGLGVFHEQASAGLASLFGPNSNFMQNWNLRWKLNLVGFRMVREHPFFGIGINSFESEIRKYTYETNVFDNRPAHNYFLLMGAETGLVGLGIVIVIGLVFARYAYRLVRHDDPFYSSFGIGALGMLVFIIGEELNSFTLKQDVPLFLFWLVFALLVAVNRMAERGAPELPRIRWFRVEPGVDAPSDTSTGVSGVGSPSGPGGRPDAVLVGAP
ncbi:MAG: O-antigen ligase family protein [Microthrixaceae bacterium]